MNIMPLRKLIILSIILGTIIFIAFVTITNRYGKHFNSKPIRYVAVGDNYTIGQGVSPSDTWPVLLMEDLQSKGVNIELVANPSVTGWTTQDVIDKGLPVFNSLNPTFATLLIGANDWVTGVDPDTFQKNLNTILDAMQAKLPNKHNIVLVTIPDFSVTPNGKKYLRGRNGTAGIIQFNDIIKSVAEQRNLPLADVFPLSENMGSDNTLIASDNLHPSAKEYMLWETQILPQAYALLKPQ